jgi:saccharopine dehydrogenase-like NADP-dependent oxidoreductase
LIDFHDKKTGFRAMERTTGWPPAIVCYLMAGGEIEPGATPLEVAVPPERFLEELSKREFQITETVTVKEER